MNVAPLATGFGIASAPVKPVLKMAEMLRRNIRALLADRKESGAELARSCGNSRYWISMFLRGDRDEVQIEDIDKMAAHFGIAPFQLISPGISRLTERRSGQDRRTGHDRRVGHTGRLLTSLRTELNKSPQHATKGGGARDPNSISADEAAILAKADRDLTALHDRRSGQQAPTDRHGKPVSPTPDRKVR
jgi:transcriptional regulator with XRE-family HTH domain